MTADGKAGALNGHDPRVSTAENYRRFGREASGRSPAYAEMAEAVAADEEVLEFLALLPRRKRQPNLLFAAARYLLGSSADINALHRLVGDGGGDLAAVMRARRTQTNEAARCATLLPALGRLPEPLALLEVGASAGLTLLPDCYSYDYPDRRLRGLDPRAPTLGCDVRGAAPLPERVPSVAWRAGIDLDPLDASNPDHARWLECMVWPGEVGREERLHDALDTARRHRPPLHRGDLVDDLARVAAEAPAGATLVVYHSAVLAYVDAARRQAFAAAVRDLGAVWLSNEAPGVVPLPAGEAHPVGDDAFALVRDGRELLAYTDSHGTWLDWIA